jgi:Ricin-type beta-trefoil lectin domain-like
MPKAVPIKPHTPKRRPWRLAACIAAGLVAASGALATVSASAATPPASSSAFHVVGAGSNLRLVGTRIFKGTTYPVYTIPGLKLPHPTPAARSASSSDPTILNLHSERCAEVYNWGTANKDNVDQWACTGGSNQKWNFRLEDYLIAGGNLYDVDNIINVHSGKCMEVYNWAVYNGANVDQWTCAPSNSPHANQLWVLDQPFLDNLNASQKRSTDVSLEVYNWGTANKDNVDIWSRFINNTNQEWSW